jgi:transcriptional regulator with XRE-family HTH domain
MNGKKIKEKIKLCGISLRDVADLLGISEQNLQNKLNVDDVKVSFVVELARKLNKDIYYFLDIQPSLQNNSHNRQITGIGSNVIASEGSSVHAPTSVDNRQYYSDSPDVLRAQIDEKEHVLIEKDNILREKDERLREKDERLREKDERLREKDTYIAELKETIKELKSK